jgi:type VI secretion system secreted protein Hcp
MAVDNFFKLDGCPGESKDDSHKGEIEVISFSLGATQTGSGGVGGGHGTTKVNFQDIHCNSYLGKHGPKLMQHCADGKHIQKAILTVRKAGGDKPLDYLIYEFEDVLVSSYQVSHAGDELAMESWSLNFDKVKMTYKEQDQKGGMAAQVIAGWDVKANKAIS